MSNIKKAPFFHWLIVAACCGFSAVTAGLAVNSMGVFYLPVATELGVGVGDVSLYQTIMNIVQGLLSAVVVRVMKKVRLRTMVTAAAAVGAACYLLMSFGTAIWHFYLVAVLLGTANGFTGVIVGNVVIENWFEKRLGTAMAVYMAVAGVVGAVLSPVFAALIESMGWRSVYRIAAALEVLLLLPAILVVRLKPEEFGMKRYGEGDGTAGGKKKRRLPLIPAEQKYGLRSSGTVLLYATACLCAFAATLSLHLSGYAHSIGRTAAFGASMISAGMIGNIATKLAAGLISDRLGAARSTIILLLFSGAGCLVLALFPSAPDLILYVAAFATGGFFAVTGVSNISLVRERFKAEEFARIVAYMAIVRMAFQAVSFSAIGYSYDIFGTYAPAMITGALIACAGILFMILIMRRKQNKLRSPVNDDKIV